MSETGILKLGLVQAPFGDGRDTNLARAEELVRQTAGQGADLVLLPELFADPYFPKVEDPAFFELAETAADSVVVSRFAQLAAELEVVLPISFFERDGDAAYNSLAMIDADGAVLGVYRKSHIPTAPATRRDSTFGPATPASASGIRARGGSESESAGINGSRRPLAQWRSRGRRFFSTRPRSAVSPNIPRSTHAIPGDGS